jgi:hypothetical protein
LFLRHLDDLRLAFRRYKVVHVICDNARTPKPDKSKASRAYLAEWRHRVVLYYLPTYAPDTTPSSGCGGGCMRRSLGTTAARA